MSQEEAGWKFKQHETRFRNLQLMNPPKDYPQNFDKSIVILRIISWETLF
jgi:hypothetical protein